MEDLDSITDEYDREFISLMITIEKRSEVLNKHDKLRIKNWCKKLCQVTNNIEWKKNRNLHAISLLAMLINQRLEEPYNKLPKDGELPIVSQTLVNCQLTPKFWSVAKSILDTNLVNNIYIKNSNDIPNLNIVSNINSKSNYKNLNYNKKNKSRYL